MPSPLRSRSGDRSSSIRHIRNASKSLVRKRPASMKPTTTATTATTTAAAAAATSQFPARLQAADDDSGEEDLTAANKQTVNMAQSIFGLVAAVGSTGNFNPPFQEQSSDDEQDESHSPGLAKTAGLSPCFVSSSLDPSCRVSSHVASPSLVPSPSLQPSSSPHSPKSPKEPLNSPKSPADPHLSPKSPTNPSHRRKISESRLFRSLSAMPRFRKESSSKKRPSNNSSSSSAAAESDANDANDADVDSEPAPVMSRILDGRAEMAARASFDIEGMMGTQSPPTAAVGEASTRPTEAPTQLPAEASTSLAPFDGNTSSSASSPSTLAQKLKDIFEFDEPEEVIKEYPCWLLQSVLLQGFMYITARHICFYAYLPKKTDKVVKAGFLGKSGRRNPKYHRYHFRLKGHQLTYHETPTDLYFQSGLIDLSYGISAMITDKDKDGTHFNVVTHDRTFHFKADSPASARDWVHSLQRVIFQSHNNGDSVKISLPIENVIDVEDTQMLDFAETVKIRVIDNDDTFAIDEYFFSFFRNSKEALDLLRCYCEKAQSKNREALASANDASSNLSPGHSPGLKPSTVSGVQSPDSSGSRAPTPSGHRHHNSLSVRTGKLPEPVKATLSPLQSPSRRRRSRDFQGAFGAQRSFSQSRTRRSVSSQRACVAGHGRHESTATSSSDVGMADLGSESRELGLGDRCTRPGERGSGSATTRERDARPIDLKASSDSYVRSLSVDESSMAMISSVEDVSLLNASATASQILHDSDVFRTLPTQNLELDGGGAGGLSQGRAEGNESPQQAGQTSTQAATEANQAQETTEANDDTSTLQGFARIGSVPLQRAGALADYLNRTSRKMSSLLASESMGYVEKVSGMWKGGRKHYSLELNAHGGGRPAVDEGVHEMDEDKIGSSNERFRAHFGLLETESLRATYFCYMMRVLPLYGKIYVSDHMFCFRSLLPGTRTKLILPLKDIETVDKEKGFRFGYSGLVLVIRGHEELFFEFGQAEVRDDCHFLMEESLEACKMHRSGCLDGEQEEGGKEEEEGEKEKETEELARTALAERDALQAERGAADNDAVAEADALQATTDAHSIPLLLFDESQPRPKPKPQTPLRITCLTIGSRGDVQPYIALCKGLLAEGHQPKIVTHAEFGPWVQSHGIDFAAISGDPAELMRLCIDNGMFTWTFLREATSMFRGWLDDLFASAWKGCQDSDVLIESPSAMAGIHIAEALQIPYFRAFTMPWTRTRAYPHAFAVPEHKMGGAYNYMTYVMFDNLFWKAIAFQVNRWRRSMLKLPSTTLEKLQANKVPFLYNFSPAVVAPPLDFSDWIRVTGYWFLNEGSGDSWTPPPDLQAFIDRARADGKKLVYVGFGSILVNDPGRMTQEVIDAVLGADVRCVLSKGWSERKTDSQTAAAAAAAGGAATSTKTPEPEIPSDIFVIKSAPHDWLFAQMDAAAHHGGSGTTGASLRAGIPTIIRPFFGDQFFFGSRVEDIGVGVCLKKWGAKSFGRALWTATRDERMRRKAAALGKSIRAERGVATAIQSLYRDMEYARGLIAAKTKRDGRREEEAEEGEEWTFVGTDEPDPEVVTQRLSEM
ncbi:hypothetical protein TD95_002722 [Thielaviopsis punctulata]|uniref:sterol 3beta-glucosyltransferase n=1 Tax=Thielaviopsis punctulata TaxID=72032 RepID=A0A0F4Z628_9PEZI|nr:hypothetical protein TD95_002722 [Thielaviopsis punctulata]